jgi:5-hydroxyisourate hydrolase-like protein (transthyretin family)
LREKNRFRKFIAAFLAGMALISSVLPPVAASSIEQTKNEADEAEPLERMEGSEKAETSQRGEGLESAGMSESMEELEEPETFEKVEESEEPETFERVETPKESETSEEVNVPVMPGISVGPGGEEPKIPMETEDLEANETNETEKETETKKEIETQKETQGDLFLNEGESEINTEFGDRMENESEVEPKTEQEAETENVEHGDYQVKIVEGEEFHIRLNHSDGRYDAGEIVEFTANVPGLAAVNTTMVEANQKGDTADLLYSEVTYCPDNSKFRFQMPADDVQLGVAVDAAENGMMPLLAGDPWDEMTDIEADTYYYYSDGRLHPFHSVMGEGGNDSYKYVRYKVSGKTYTVNAYCMQHSMQSPPSGTTYKSMVELKEGGDDKYLRKALFYGYGGPGWGHTFKGYNIKTIMEEAGCTSEMQVMQHYLVDYLYDGEAGFGGALSDKAKHMLREIKAALAKMPDPTEMQLLPGLSVAASGRETETFIWKADEAFTITLDLEKGVNLVNETTGETASGKVTVKGGERFHLVAVTDEIGALNGKYTITSNYPLDFHAMLLKLQKSQDISFGYYTDSSDIELLVEWPEPKYSLAIYKEGENLTGAEGAEEGVTFLYENARQKGAVYNVYAGEDIKSGDGTVQYSKGSLVKEGLVTGEDGSVILSDLYPGTYVVTETKAPDNLVCNRVSETIIIGREEEQTEHELHTLTVQNERQKAVVIAVKQDETTKNPLSGGSYGLYAAEDIRNAEGEVIVGRDTLLEKAVTDAEGRAVFQADLPINYSYYVREIQAPNLYLRDGDRNYVFDFRYSNDNQEIVEFVHTFKNKRTEAAIKLVKKDRETGAESQGEAILTGAVYGLYAREDIVHPDGRSGVLYRAGEQIAALTIDENQSAEIRSLYLGKYYVKEISAPAGYLLDSQEYDVYCDYEGDQINTVERTIEVPEQVIKQPFQVIKAANNGKTDADLLEGVGFRAYLKRSLTVKTDGSYDFTSAKPVVLTEDGKTEMFTDKNGYACSVALPYGTYVVRETTTPHNYKPVKDFVVSIREHHPDEPQAWRVLLDDEFEAKLKIVKKDSGTKKPILAAGTEFKIYDTVHQKYVEQSTTYPNLVTHRSYVTDSEGCLILPEPLKIGRYRIEEVTAPEGYTLSDAFVEIEVDSDTAYQIDHVSGDVVIEAEYENDSVRGELVLGKRGSVLTDYNGDFVYEDIDLEGTEFDIYAGENIYTPDFQKGEDGNRLLLYAEGTLVATVSTNAYGKAMVSDLPLGRYQVVETKAPEGFVLQKAPVMVDLLYDGPYTPVVKKEIAIKNDRQKVKLTVEKQSVESGAAIAGAVFGIYNKEDIKAGERILVKADTLLQEITSDEKGLAVCTLDLPLGRYYVKELKAPEGFVSSEEILEFDATYQGQETESVELKARKTNHATKVRVRKTDLTGELEVPGAKLTIFDEQNQVVESWISEESPHDVEQLPVGTYILREEQAPKGYAIGSELSFHVLNTEEIQTVSMKNETVRGKVIIHKLDQDTKKPLKGVEFELSDEEGNILETLITDKDGYAESVLYEIAAFQNGIYEKDRIYELVETKTADGYELDKTRHKVVFPYQNDTTAVVELQLELTNKRETVKRESETSDKGNHEEAPKTGDTTNILFWALLLMGSCACISAIWLGRKRKGRRV